MDGFNSSGQQVVWDATSITAASTCPRKYYYQILQSWTGNRQSIHLVFGKIFASAVERFFKTDFNNTDYETALINTIRFVLKSSENETAFENEKSKSRLMLCRAVIYYLDKYFEYDYPRLFDAGGEIGIEMTFAIEIEKDWVLTGRIDRIIHDQNGIQILDQKTSGGPLDRKYFANYTPNNQISAYQLAGQIAFPKRVAALLIDAISIAGGKITFARQNIARSKSQLNEWVKNTKSLIENIHSFDPNDHTSFPQNPSACGMFGGCPFREVCSHNPEVRDILLNEDFIKSPWNPVKGVSVNGT